MISVFSTKIPKNQKYIIFAAKKLSAFPMASADKRRNGRAVECGGLENRCSPTGEPGVRIPLSPQSLN